MLASHPASILNHKTALAGIPTDSDKRGNALEASKYRCIGDRRRGLLAVGGFCLRFHAGFRGVAALSGQPASYGGRASFVEDAAEHVVGEVGHTDLYRRPIDANCADAELHLVLLPGEDMLDG